MALSLSQTLHDGAGDDGQSNVVPCEMQRFIITMADPHSL